VVVATARRSHWWRLCLYCSSSKFALLPEPTNLNADISALASDDDDFDHWCRRPRSPRRSLAILALRSSDVLATKTSTNTGRVASRARVRHCLFSTYHHRRLGTLSLRHLGGIRPGADLGDDALLGLAPFHYGVGCRRRRLGLVPCGATHSCRLWPTYARFTLLRLLPGSAGHTLAYIGIGEAVELAWLVPWPRAKSIAFLSRQPAPTLQT